MGESLDVINVSCGNCVGACCRRGTAIQPTDREAYNNKRKMMLERVVKSKKFRQAVQIRAEGFTDSGELVPVPTVMSIGAGYGLYLMQEDCGHLTPENECGIWGSPQRPRACENYEVGSEACLEARQAAGLIDLQPPSADKD